MFENVRLSPAFLFRPSGAPSPRGKVRQLVLPSVGVRWYAVGLGRCGHRPLRRGWGCDGLWAILESPLRREWGCGGWNF